MEILDCLISCGVFLCDMTTAINGAIINNKDLYIISFL